MSKVLVCATSVALAALSACAMAPQKPQKPAQSAAMHVDVSYTQFILQPGSNNKQPYDLSLLGDVAVQCNGAAAPKRAGGAAGTALSLANALVGKLLSAALQSLQKWVGEQIAQYSVSMTSKEVNVGFYAPDLWFAGADDARYSCFVIAVNRCATSQIDKTTGLCVRRPGVPVHAVIIGQYRLTRESLQVRPLYGYVVGFAAKRGSAASASIAATLKISSVWWDGRSGHVDDPIAVPVLTKTFKPDPNGIDLAVQQKVNGTYAFADWGTQPLLRRPSRTRHSVGTAGITATVAEANSPPKGLELIQKVLDGNSADISSALKSALTALPTGKK